MNTLEVNNTTYSYPSHWSEITDRKTFLAIAGAASIGNHLAVLCALFPQAPSILKAVPNTPDMEYLHELTALGIDYDPVSTTERALFRQELLQSVAFAHSPEGYTVDHLKYFELDGIEYQGAGDFFELLTFDAYVHADGELFDYAQAGGNDVKYLQNLAACIYTPKGEKFKVDTYTARCEAFRNAPAWVLWSAFMYFAGCKQAMLEYDRANPHAVFSHSREGKEQGDDEQEEEEEPPQAQAQAFDWSDTTLWLAELGILGNVEAVEQSYFWKVYKVLSREGQKVKNAQKNN